MIKQEILTARLMDIEDLLEAGFTMPELADEGIVTEEYYLPSESTEYFDGEYFYNAFGQQLRNPSEFDPYSEGYTPFGDE